MWILFSQIQGTYFTYFFCHGSNWCFSWLIWGVESLSELFLSSGSPLMLMADLEIWCTPHEDTVWAMSYFRQGYRPTACLASLYVTDEHVQHTPIPVGIWVQNNPCRRCWLIGICGSSLFSVSRNTWYISSLVIKSVGSDGSHCSWILTARLKSSIISVMWLPLI